MISRTGKLASRKFIDVAVCQTDPNTPLHYRTFSTVCTVKKSKSFVLTSVFRKLCYLLFATQEVLIEC
jgi:hypothetical protein